VNPLDDRIDRMPKRLPAGAGDASAERERERLDAGIEEFDRERSIDDGRRLSDQLVQPPFHSRSIATLVDVEAMSGTRRLPVDCHAN